MLDFLPTIQPGHATLLVGGLSLLFTAHMHFFRWLSKRFEKLNESITHLGNEHKTQLNIHEKRDQQRHEENLTRFQELNIAIARLEEHVEAQKDQSRPGSKTSTSRTKSSFVH